MKKMKKYFLRFMICLCVISLCPVSTFATHTEHSFYCVRNKNHTQPTLDSNISFIEELDGFYVDRRHQDSSVDKVIYLTFDAGYENGNIEKILNVLEEEQVTGAFFILENLILKNPELVKRMSDEGHDVCNHTSKHRNITKLTTISQLSEELKAMEKLYYNLTGKEMKKYFRPPEGRFNYESMKLLQQLGYKTIFWSFAYADWDNANQMSAEQAKTKIFDNIHNGEIMLLHPTSATNAEILQDIIKELKMQGYRFGTLDELVGETQ